LHVYLGSYKKPSRICDNPLYMKDSEVVYYTETTREGANKCVKQNIITPPTSIHFRGETLLTFF